MNERPDPDRLLARVQADEERSDRGRLKLFFGASPGVGKTYTMLEAARQRKKEGWDVVVGLVETHQRVETAALLGGLEVLSRKEIFYKGVALREFDLDGALRRRPRLLVVDELAHTNAPGLRHAKRWQDIEELLDAGIDIYTTVNVQHWETLNDVVAQITGVRVRETVPDTFLRRAHELEMVDLAPDDLLQRLKDGKVYQGELAGRASENFFQPGNLIALRELALRHAAERVDEQMQSFKERHGIGEVWAVGERLLVGVSPAAVSASLVRATSRLATRLRAPWLAVHVETPAFLSLSDHERGRAIDNLRLAERLGAETATLTGDDVTDELLAFARSRNVTRIILGKPNRPRWREWLFGSIVNQLARRCGNIDLNIISAPAPEKTEARRAAAHDSRPMAGFFDAAGVVILSTLICWPLSHALDRVNLVMIYLIGVVVAAHRFGRRASTFTSVLSVLSFDFFFVPPTFKFSVSDTQYLLTFAIMLGVGLLIGSIMSRLRLQTETLRARAERMRALYRLSRELSETPEPRQMMGTAASRLAEFYRRPILILTPDEAGALEVSAGDAGAFGWNDNERPVAQWVLDRGQMAGAGSATLSGAAGLYLPMRGLKGTVGVLGIRPPEPKTLHEPEQLQLLETFASEIGGALESTRLSEAIGRAEVELELQAMKAPRALAPMKISDRLGAGAVVFLTGDLSKERICRELLARLTMPNPAKALQAILERENAVPTRIGVGVAVPHARIAGVDGLQLALGISKDGPVRLWFLFVSPAEDPKLHLMFLAAIATFFRETSRAEKLANMSSAEEALAFVRREEG